MCFDVYCLMCRSTTLCVSFGYGYNLSSCFQVILPGGVSYAEVGGALAVSKVCVVEVGRTSSHSDAWLLLWEGGVSIHIHKQQALMMELSMLSHHGNSHFTPGEICFYNI